MFGFGLEGFMVVMSVMEFYYVNGFLGLGDMDGLLKSFFGVVVGLSNVLGILWDDGEMVVVGIFLYLFLSESYLLGMIMSV